MTESDRQHPPANAAVAGRLWASAGGVTPSLPIRTTPAGVAQSPELPVAGLTSWSTSPTGRPKSQVTEIRSKNAGRSVGGYRRASDPSDPGNGGDPQPAPNRPETQQRHGTRLIPGGFGRHYLTGECADCGRATPPGEAICWWCEDRKRRKIPNEKAP